MAEVGVAGGRGVSTAGDVENRSDTVCIVGAGPHGLIAARAMRKSGLKVEIIERHSGVGGLWDIANPGTPMYRSCHYISSRNTSAYPDYPMPDDYADYPSNTHILAYIQGFASKFDLIRLAEFNTEVQHAEPLESGDWIVTLQHLPSGAVQRRRYRALVCCPGSNWHPRMPALEGAFSGEIIHSAAYTDSDQLEGKRVLVIGLGNSGADIACDSARSAAATFISVRRGYHFVPKYVCGMPLLEFLRGSREGIPKHIAELPLEDLFYIIVGDPTRLGLPKPDHGLLESHPLLNTQLIHHLGHGDVVAKGAIDRLDGSGVVFKDGTREDVDLIICATGYDHLIPFIDPELTDWQDGRPQLYLGSFSARYPTLFTFGLIEAAGAPYLQGDQLSVMAAHYLKARKEAPDVARTWEQLVQSDVIDLKEGMHYIATNRTANYVNVEVFVREVERVRALMGWPEVRPGFYDPACAPALAAAE